LRRSFVQALCDSTARRSIAVAMGLPAARRVLVLGLLAGCLALLPFLRDDLGTSSTFLPICLAAAAVCDLLTALLLAAQFLGRGSSQLLGLACAYLAAGLLAVVHLLAAPGALTDGGVLSAGDQAPAWLWAVGHGGLPIGLAAALWGGPVGVRRRLAGPTARRARAVALAFGTVVAGGALLAWAIVAAGSGLPTVVDDGRLSDLGLVAGPLVVGLGLAALVIVARRGRRSPIERRLLVVVACVLAGTALTLATLSEYSVGWYASSVLDLVASTLLLALLVGGVGRLGALGTVADHRAGAADALTGVKTRAATLVAAEQLHQTRAPGAPLGLALIDVDGLKAIGDRHGALAADAVLMSVAGRLGSLLRDADVLGRAGDEGFLIVLPDTDADGVTLAIDRAVAAIREQKVGTWAHDVRTTASAGIAMVGPGDGAVAQALAAADLALNQAKAHGRDQVVSPARAQVVPLRRAGAGPPRG
jgi:diguanylate cyclase (GGDEF)-like protein